MQYNNLIYNSGPVNVKDYVSNRYNIVHNQLYEDALYNYIYGYVKDLITKNIFYNLFCAMNNCITEFNDIEKIAYLDNINNIKQNQLYKIISIEDIHNSLNTENPLINMEYTTILMNYINNSSYSNEFNNVFKELSIDNITKEKYINYIIVNIVSLMEDIKTKITEIQHIDVNNNINKYFSDFIIRYRNSLYITHENELTLFNTELSNNEIFIYEEQYKMDYHIGFNKDGYFILDIDDDIDITNAYDQLYYMMSYINYLLLGMLYDHITKLYIDSNTIIEKPNIEYYMPSSIIIYQKSYPHRKKVVDLTPYWSDYNDHSNVNIEDIKIKEEEIRDSQIEDINYVTGKLKVYSKMYDIEYNIDKKYISENTNIDDELINNTFIQIYKNNY